MMDSIDGVMSGFGIVKFFDERAGNRYGFIRVCDNDGKETEDEVFFHYNDGNPNDPNNPLPLPIPRPGDSIVFCLIYGKEGKPKACPWKYDVRATVGYAMDEPDWTPDDFVPDDDEICEGICGQPAYACTCAETEAFREHNANPATRGSYFVA
jgi:cold shock CspA family protein